MTIKLLVHVTSIQQIIGNAKFCYVSCHPFQGKSLSWGLSILVLKFLPPLNILLKDHNTTKGPFDIDKNTFEHIIIFLN
jgi:hypothetical protein